MPDETLAKFVVVMNYEEQYSIWEAARELPPGWSSAAFAGSRDACLSYIEDNWHDMRPKSLRTKLVKEQ